MRTPSGYPEQRVAHSQDELADDLRALVMAEQVVDVGDRTSVGILDRNHGRAHFVGLESREYLGERPSRDERGARKERGRGGLGERAGETLVGDLAQRYTAVRHSAWLLSSPRAIAK